MVHLGDVAEWVTAAVAAIGLIAFTFLEVRSNANTNKDRLFEESYDAANAVWGVVTQSRERDEIVGMLTIHNQGRRAVFDVHANLMTKDGETPFARHVFVEVAPHRPQSLIGRSQIGRIFWDGAGNSTAKLNLTFADPWGNEWERKSQGRLHATKNKYLR